MAEGARLESVFRGNSNVGSNPTLSASLIIPFYLQSLNLRHSEIDTTRQYLNLDEALKR